MSDRDEIAQIIMSPRMATNMSGDRQRAIADDILAAGYRKPRTVTTIEELEALPGNSVVRDNGVGYVWDKADGELWWRAGVDDEYHADKIKLPATVLYVPEAGDGQ